MPEHGFDDALRTVAQETGTRARAAVRAWLDAPTRERAHEVAVATQQDAVARRRLDSREAQALDRLASLLEHASRRRSW